MNMARSALKNFDEIAEESLKTKKSREKLKKRLEDLDRKVTPEALKEKSSEIEQWISRRSDRLVLKEKFSLFDENQNAAKLSSKTAKLADQLRKQGSI